MKAKLYLEPKGENGLPLHSIANIDECMKYYEKKTGLLLTHEKLKSVFVAGVMLGSGAYQLGQEVNIELEYLKILDKL
jgi:hypothetical protein